MRIGVDLLGSDSSPELLLEAVEELDVVAELVTFGPDRFEEITTDDHPLLALRRKRDASIPSAMRALRDGDIDAFVSLGNTGALVASAAFTLPMLPGVDRPGLLTTLPTLSGSLAVLDVGANISLKPRQYLQFARLGAAYQQCTADIRHPRVGLLNIGTERIKGTRGIRDAHELLHSSDLSFVGNVEGRDAFTGDIDVLVTDGFSGNIFLKTAEGISMFILNHLREAFGDAVTPQVEEVLGDLNRHFNYAEYPGALVAGVDGVVVKCHGFSSKQAIQNGIRGAIRLVETNLIDRIKSALSPSM
jgi:phosphate acyltransferase